MCSGCSVCSLQDCCQAETPQNKKARPSGTLIYLLTVSGMLPFGFDFRENIFGYFNRQKHWTWLVGEKIVFFPFFSSVYCILTFCIVTVQQFQVGVKKSRTGSQTPSASLFESQLFWVTQWDWKWMFMPFNSHSVTPALMIPNAFLFSQNVHITYLSLFFFSNFCWAYELTYFLPLPPNLFFPFFLLLLDAFKEKGFFLPLILWLRKFKSHLFSAASPIYDVPVHENESWLFEKVRFFITLQ